MKAMVLTEYKSAFRLQEMPLPQVKPGEVLVRVMASAVNPLDLKIKDGQAAHAQTRLPAVLGIDMAGVVETVGADVINFKPGDEVYGMIGGVGGLQGSLAEYVAVDTDLIALKPQNMPFREAAALPLVFITAWEGLVHNARVEAGQTVLIQGGAGGVGHVAVQIAVARGAKVFATVSPDNAALIKSLGATPIDYTSMTVEQYVDLYTHGEGFDVILDTVGGSVLDNSFNAATRYTGHVVSILGWGTHSLAPLSFRNAMYSGVFTLYPLISGKARARHIGGVLKEATGLVEAGRLRVVLADRQYDLTEVEKAYDEFRAGGIAGKLVITIRQSKP